MTHQDRRRSRLPPGSDSSWETAMLLVSAALASSSESCSTFLPTAATFMALSKISILVAGKDALGDVPRLLEDPVAHKQPD